MDETKETPKRLKEYEERVVLRWINAVNKNSASQIIDGKDFWKLEVEWQNICRHMTVYGDRELSSSRDVFSVSKDLKPHSSISYSELVSVIGKKEAKLVGLVGEPGSDQTILMRRFASDLRKGINSYRRHFKDDSKTFEILHFINGEKVQDTLGECTPFQLLYGDLEHLYASSPFGNTWFHPLCTTSSYQHTLFESRKHVGYKWLKKNSSRAIFFIHNFDFIVETYEKIGYFDAAPPQAILYNLVVGNLFPDATIVVSCQGHLAILEGHFGNLQKLKSPRMIIAVAHTTIRWIKQVNENCRRWISTEPSLSQLWHMGSDVVPAMEIIDYSSSSKSVMNDLKKMRTQGSISYIELWNILKRKQISIVGLVGEQGNDKTFLMKKLAQEVMTVTYDSDSELFEMVHFVTFETQNSPDQTTPYDFLFKKPLASNHDFAHRSSSEGPMSSGDSRTHDGYNWLIKNSCKAIFFIDGLDYIIQGHEHEKIGYFNSAPPSTILYNLIVGNFFPDATVVVSCRGHSGIHTLQKLKSPRLIIAVAHSSWIKQINNNCRRWIRTEPSPSQLERKGLDFFPEMEIIDYSSSSQSVMNVSKRLKSQGSISFTELWDTLKRKQINLVGFVGKSGSDKTFLMKILADGVMTLTPLPKLFKLVHFVMFETQNSPDLTTPYDFLFQKSMASNRNFPHRSSSDGAMSSVDPRTHDGYNWLIENSSEAFFFIDGVDSIIQGHEHEKIGHFDTASPSTILYNLIVGNLFPDATIVVSCQGHVGILQKLKRSRLIIAVSQLTTTMRWIKQINDNFKRWIRNEPSPGQLEHKESDVYPTMEIINYSSSNQSVMNILKELKTRGSMSYTGLSSIFERKQITLIGLVGEPGSGKTLLMKKLAQDVMRVTDVGSFPFSISKQLFDLVHFVTFENQNIPDQTTPYDFLFQKSLVSNHDFPHRSSSEGTMSLVDPRTHDGYNWLIKNSSKAVFFIGGIDSIIQGHEHEMTGYFDSAPPSTILYNLIVGNLFPDATVVVSCRGHFSILQKLKRSRLIIAVTQTTMRWIKQINDNCKRWIRTKPSRSPLSHMGSDVFPAMKIIDYNSSSQSVMNTSKILSYTGLRSIFKCKQRTLVGLVGEPGSGKTFLMKKLAQDMVRVTDLGSFPFLISKQLFELVHFVTFETQKSPEQTTPYDFLFKKSLMSNHDFPHRSSSDPRTHDGYNWLIKNSGKAIFFIEGLDSIIRGHEHEKIGCFDPAPPSTILYNLIVGNLFPDATVVVSCGDQSINAIFLESTKPHLTIALLGTFRVFIGTRGPEEEEKWTHSGLSSENFISSDDNHSLDKCPLDNPSHSHLYSDSYIEVGNGISVNFFKPIKLNHEVFLGRVNGGDKEVAVKKMELSAEIEELVQKLLLLKQHPNIVHCMAMSIHEEESGEKFIYIAMELCSSITLHDLVESEASDFNISKEIMLQILHALAYLHKNEVYLGRLETKHILSQDRKNVKINPFRTTRDLSDHAPGERGPLDTKQFPHFSEKLDVFSAGSIFAHSSTKNADGEKDSSSPSVLILDEQDLINSMLERDPSKRITINDAICHPFFWEESEKLIFCRNLFDNLLSFSDSPGVLEQLEKVSAETICQGWFEKLVLSEKEDFDIHAELRASKNKMTVSKTALLAIATSRQNGSPYNQKSAFSLLRFIINRYNGFENDPKEVQILFGSRKRIWQFFVKRVPDLFYKLYNFSKQLVLDTTLWRLEVSEPGLNVKSLYNDITPVSVIGQQGGILRVGGTVVSIDEGTFLYPCAVWAAEDLDHLTWDDEYISISPQLDVRFQYPLLKPATVCMNTWCTSGTDVCEVYVFHYTKGDGSADIIATLPLGYDRQLEFKCQTFSPISVKIMKLLGISFVIAGYMYKSNKNELRFAFCLDNSIVKNEVKSDMGGRPDLLFSPIKLPVDHKIRITLTCEESEKLKYDFPEHNILVNEEFISTQRVHFSSSLINPPKNQTSCMVRVTCEIYTGTENMAIHQKQSFYHDWISEPVLTASAKDEEKSKVIVDLNVDVHTGEKRITTAEYVAMDDVKLQTGSPASENESRTIAPSSSTLPSSSETSSYTRHKKTIGVSTKGGDELKQTSSSMNITSKIAAMDRSTVKVKETGTVSLVDCKFGTMSENKVMEMARELASSSVRDDKNKISSSSSDSE